MAFFRTVSFSEPLPTIEGDGVFLRAPQMSDYSEWTTLREASRAFLTPWEPTWPGDDLSRSAFRRRLRTLRSPLPTPQPSGANPRERAPGGLLGCRRGWYRRLVGHSPVDPLEIFEAAEETRRTFFSGRV